MNIETQRKIRYSDKEMCIADITYYRNDARSSNIFCQPKDHFTAGPLRSGKSWGKASLSLGQGKSGKLVIFKGESSIFIQYVGENISLLIITDVLNVLVYS